MSMVCDGFGTANESGDPGRTARNAKFPKENNTSNRDTAGISEPLKVNSLVTQAGHTKPRKTSSLSRHMKPEHKRMSRMMGYTLTLSGFDAWEGFSLVAMARMTTAERAALSWASLRSLDTPEQVELVAESVLKPAGCPLPTFLSPMADARWHAAYASPTERKAYALAHYEALSPREQMAFRKHISEVEIAA